MRDLADPANPYLGQYGEWDYWAYANGRELTSTDWEIIGKGEAGSSRHWMSIGVDKDGFPVPVLQQVQEQCERYRDMTNWKAGTCVMSFNSFGEIPAALRERLQQAQAAVKARYAPPIPAWLGQAPPLWAMILPTGEIVTLGDLGSGKDYDPAVSRADNAYLEDNSAAYRFSAAGELLGQTADGVNWYTLFWPDAGPELGQYDPNATATWPEAGYIVVRKLADWSVLAVYNYDGSPMPADTNTMARDLNVWQGWFGQEIAMLYKAQQEEHK